MINPKTTTSSSCFPTTRWTQIIGGIQSNESKTAWEALNDFCERYRPAIYNFFRRRGCSSEQAEDYTHDFFARRILERWDDRDGFLHAVRKSEQGKFRSFLCHILWRFLQDKWKESKTQRTGGGATHIPLEDMETSGSGTHLETFDSFGRQFDRVFALEVIQKAAERSKHSKYLEAHLRGEISQEAAAKELGISENAFKQSFSRFRERLALALWEEVSKLVGPDEGEIRAEIRYLMSIFVE